MIVPYRNPSCKIKWNQMETLLRKLSKETFAKKTLLRKQNCLLKGVNNDTVNFE